MHPYPIALVLLAAGVSRRMQQPSGKMNLCLPDGRTLLQTTLETYMAIPFAEIIVVTRQPVLTLGSAQKNTRIIVNENAESGMASSLALGVASATEEVRGYMIALGDMPLVRATSIKALCTSFILQHSTEAICVPTLMGQRGNPVVFGSAYKADLIHLFGDVGAKSLLRQYAERLQEVETNDEGILVDIDTEEDWLRFLEQKSRRTS